MRVNGEETACAAGMTVLSLLQTRGLDPQRVAVEVSGAIVPRSSFAETALSDTDKVEIVAFVGGG